MATHTSAFGLRRRATTPLMIWSGIAVLTLLTAGWLRFAEGASGPWHLAGVAGMFSLFGVADAMGDRGVWITRLAFASFIAVGAALGWETAQMRHGYIALYGFAAAWLLFLFDLVIAVGLLIPRVSEPSASACSSRGLPPRNVLCGDLCSAELGPYPLAGTQGPCEDRSNRAPLTLPNRALQRTALARRR